MMIFQNSASFFLDYITFHQNAATLKKYNILQPVELFGIMLPFVLTFSHKLCMIKLQGYLNTGTGEYCMFSQNIYLKTRLEQDRNKGAVVYDGTPDEILLESVTSFDPEFAQYMPCQILSLSHYRFSHGFCMQTQNVGMYDLIYLYSGALTVQLPLGEYSARACDFLMLNTDIRYTLRQCGNEKLDILIIRNYGFSCSSYYHLLMGKGFHPLSTHNDTVFETLLDRLIFYFSYPSNANNMLIVDAMNRIYTQLYIHDAGLQPSDNKYCHPEWFVTAIEYMEQNYQNKLTVGKIAEAVGISESLFYKKFRKYTNTTPTDYLLNIRIQHAKQLLLNTNEQIKYIAYETGFHNTGYFIKQFQDATGLSPKHFRENRCMK